MAITYLGGAASQSAGGNCDITISSGVTTSQGIIVLAAIDTNSFPVAPTDTAGNTYTRDDGFNAGGPSLDIAIFSCLSPTALSAGNIITLNASLGSQRQAWHAYKFDLPIAFDGTGGTSNGEGRGSGTAVSDNLQPLTTANANDCLFGGVLADTASTLTGVTAGWNAASTPSVTTDTNMRLFAFSQVVSATGTYPLSGTLGTSSNWEVVNAGYKYTAGGGTVYAKTGAGVAKLYATGVRGGHVVWLKKGAGVAKLYATGAKAYITSGFLTTTMPVVPFRQQSSHAAYNKTGAAVSRLYATGAKQYLVGGTGTLYQKTGAATGRLYTTGDSQGFYAKSGAGLARLYATGARTGGTIPPPPTPPLYVLRDAVFTVAGFDLSNHVDSVEVLIHQDMIDITKYGDTAIHYTLGLRTDQITCTFIQDFGLSTVHSVISNLLASSGFTVTAKPRSGVTAVTNPLYSATCIVTSYTPLSAKVGDRSDAPVVFQAISPITQATS